MPIRNAHASSSRAMQMDDIDDDDMIEEDAGGREAEDDIEQWTIDSFKSLPMSGESAANMASLPSLLPRWSHAVLLILK